MTQRKQKDILSTLKTVLIAGYAISLFFPYKVEKHDGETTYHAPLYKLSYKTNKIETTEKDAESENEALKKQQTLHTYTITSFGLLNDQIATAQRLYKAALLKRPAVEAKAQAAAACIKKTTLSAAKATKDGAVNAAKAIKSKVEDLHKPAFIIEDVTDRLDELIDDIID